MDANSFVGFMISQIQTDPCIVNNNNMVYFFEQSNPNYRTINITNDGDRITITYATFTNPLQVRGITYNGNGLCLRRNHSVKNNATSLILLIESHLKEGK